MTKTEEQHTRLVHEHIKNLETINRLEKSLEQKMSSNAEQVEMPAQTKIPEFCNEYVYPANRTHRIFLRVPYDRRM